MSKIDELIKELCPNGVEFKELRDVCEFKNGFAFKSNLFLKKGSAIIRITNIKNKYIDDSNLVYFDLNDYSEDLSQYKVNVGDILIAMSGATTGKIGFFKSDKDFYLNQRVGKFIPKKNLLSNKFLFHFLLTKIKKMYVLGGAGAQPNLSSNKLMKEIIIPLPPLPIQKEIVKILDEFIELEENLTKELGDRKKQYEFYREELLRFDEEHIGLGKIGNLMKVVRGASPRPIQAFLTKDTGGINWIKIGDINLDDKFVVKTKQKINLEGAKKSRLLKKGDFILSNSMSFGRPYILEIDGCIHDGWIALSDFEKKIERDFLYYLLKSNLVQRTWEKKASSGTVRNLNADIIRDTEIPIPFPKDPVKSLKIQKEIVEKLDKFDELVNKILPKEIELRKKQYEFYRDKLLSFKELKK